ncbi:hypothetical protein GUJ93_ZPchr0007g3140 [Zizania palustris]|uniref:Uncharacterized protein n=1 Tax=Zizania palustris TaxID=103762 RepID=A0A8J5VRE1_ZIZPA|nr:hypothetical protein GUJ93_ZPchr0007g3140 [Zizania palustris]
MGDLLVWLGGGGARNLQGAEDRRAASELAGVDGVWARCSGLGREGTWGGAGLLGGGLGVGQRWSGGRAAPAADGAGTTCAVQGCGGSDGGSREGMQWRVDSHRWLAKFG